MKKKRKSKPARPYWCLHVTYQPKIERERFIEAFTPELSFEGGGTAFINGRPREGDASFGGHPTKAKVQRVRRIIHNVRRWKGVKAVWFGIEGQ